MCFTINNPAIGEHVDLFARLILHCFYAVFQYERGEAGTLHIQGFAQCKTRKSFAWWKELIGLRAHLEKARGSPQQNRVYCTKPQDPPFADGPFEHGLCPEKRGNQGDRTDIDGAIACCKRARSVGEIIDEFPTEFVKYRQSMLFIKNLTSVKRQFKTCIVWLYGATGTGKSRLANLLAPDAYWKDPSTKWWDGYDGQKEVIVDDFRADFMKFAELLRFFDRYPFQREFKGGHCEFIGEVIYITSPRHPLQTWDTRTSEDLAQLGRRIEHINMFPIKEGFGNGCFDKSGDGSKCEWCTIEGSRLCSEGRNPIPRLVLPALVPNFNPGFQ